MVYSNLKVGAYFRLKSKVPVLFKPKLLYQFSCPPDEGMSCIGMTTTQWLIRIGQHFDSSKKCAIFIHLAQCLTYCESKPKSKYFTVLKKL